MPSTPNMCQSSSPYFVAPGAGFVGDSFSTGGVREMVSG